MWFLPNQSKRSVVFQKVGNSGKICVFMCSRQCDFSFSKNDNRSFAPNTFRQNTSKSGKQQILALSRQYDFTFLFCLCFSLRIRFRWWKTLISRIYLDLFLVFSSFLIRFVTMSSFSRRWVNLQTHAKLCSSQNHT